MPATQGRHGQLLAPVYPTLHAQLLKAVLPAAELEFPGQAANVEATVAVEYVPMAQLRHALAKVAPTVAEYLLTPQAVHVPPFGPVYPALHTHWVEAVLTCAEFEPTGQTVHNAVPVTALKVPATQGGHGPLLAQVYPTLHAQLL